MLLHIAFYSFQLLYLYQQSEDYFLASRSLPWWAITIAANISAEQIIGMSGQGFVVGMAIATYELTAAVALIVMAKYFNFFKKTNLYNATVFEYRFDKRVSLVLAFFWLAVYVFINLTSVLWLGSLAINSLTGFDLTFGLVFLALLSLSYSLWGGLKAVALTDILQVANIWWTTVSVLALHEIASMHDGSGVIYGAVKVFELLPEKFDMILSVENPSYRDLPNIGGLWIAHFAYWGFNQYITQRGTRKHKRELFVVNAVCSCVTRYLCSSHFLLLKDQIKHIQ